MLFVVPQGSISGGPRQEQTNLQNDRDIMYFMRILRAPLGGGLLQSTVRMHTLALQRNFECENHSHLRE